MTRKSLTIPPPTGREPYYRAQAEMNRQRDEMHRRLGEIDGGAFIRGGGGHNRGSAVHREHEKMNRAACDGWRVLHCTPQNIMADATYGMVRKALEAAR